MENMKGNLSHCACQGYAYYVAKIRRESGCESHGEIVRWTLEGDFIFPFFVSSLKPELEKQI